MSGETPPDDETPKTGTETDSPDLSLGQTLYTEARTLVGPIRGFDEGGVFVTTRDGAKRLTVEHARSGHEFGAAELVWRCTECGGMGVIEGGLPDCCSGCGTPKEALVYWTED